MSKKDYELIARVLREQRTRATDVELWRLDETARAFATEFAATNPRFATQRFIAACRGEDSTDSAGRRVRYAS